MGNFGSSNNGYNSQIAYNTYTNQYMSFQYPAGWQIQNNSIGGANVNNNSNSSEWFTVVPYGNYGGNVSNMTVYQQLMAADIS